jgi:hypothetical protein
MIELRSDRLDRGKARYSLRNSAEFKEEEHPRAEDGKFGSGGSKGETEDEDNLEEPPKKEKDKVEEIRPQSEIPKPQIAQKMGEEWLSGIAQYISDYAQKSNENRDKKEAFDYIKRQFKKNDIEYIDAYHVTDKKSIKGGIHGSSLSSTGESEGNIRDSSVYMFLDPKEIPEGFQGITGTHGEENTVMHIKIPVSKLNNMIWDSNYNMTFGIHSAVRIPGDVPSKWIDGMYKYKHGDKIDNSQSKVTIYRHA